jgi:ribulose-5-phosphate 4-epimerase/fuculose-1-phosphate aldolase
MREIDVGRTLPVYYWDDEPGPLKDFIIYTKRNDGIVSKEFRLPEKFNEDIREHGITYFAISVHRLYDNVETVRKGAKDYCRRHHMNLIENPSGSVEVENGIIRKHMEELYEIRVDFDPLAELRNLSELTPSP